jgi:iron-sulfur cluster assembly accessory protein
MIYLSSAAAREILRLRSKREPNEDLLFRLGVQPSSCLPLAYTMNFDHIRHLDDQLYECEGIQIVVNQESLSYLDGLSLDYSEDLMGGGFRFHNPNAIQTCGCGNSFAVTD